MRAVHYIFIFFLLSCSLLIAQTKKVDSLRTVLLNLKTCPTPCRADTVRVKLQITLVKQLKKISEFDSAFFYARAALALSEKIDFKRGRGDAYNALGEIYRAEGNYAVAMQNYRQSLEIATDIQDKRGMGMCYNNIGLVLDKQGDYPGALKSYFLSLKIKDEMNDRGGKAGTFINIGNVYYNRSEYPSALNYFNKALEIYKETNDKYGLSACYFSVGNVLNDKGNYGEALKNYEASLKIKNELGDKRGIASLVNNIGNVHFYLKDYEKALANYFLYIEQKEKIKDRGGIGSAYNNIGRTYQIQGKLKEAAGYLTKGLELSLRENVMEDIGSAYGSLAEVYETQKEFRKGLDAFKMYIVYRDSLFNEENTKKTVQLEMNYEFEKKQATTKLDQEKKDAVAAAEVKKQKIILFAISGFGVLVLGFALFAYRSFLQKKKANREITEQKHVIEEKQKEILDSIYYARRIQQSLLPSEKYLQRLMGTPRK